MRMTFRYGQATSCLFQNAFSDWLLSRACPLVRSMRASKPKRVAPGLGCVSNLARASLRLRPALQQCCSLRPDHFRIVRLRPAWRLIVRTVAEVATRDMRA